MPMANVQALMLHCNECPSGECFANVFNCYSITPVQINQKVRKVKRGEDANFVMGTTLFLLRNAYS